ncbi:MAG: gliding motility-associated C-terminal domain-containing protein [Flavobacteriales bacterium]|nr:gliding motility-associated C-terminal domain-containing protein [Flavobacteriales bacterium]MCX7767704.1 gliding motility-associated C-terminal domain-containing protein [Flavobacteriales bacterium]MDW8409401.1 gliding motility-associated C-terminal domain-containing protein [Flavobacteriales bacterium]
MKRESAKSIFSTLFSLIFLNSSLFSQCFEIESILVDACGSPESNNEMLIFRVGNTPLNVNDMFVDWPNNPFLGICQNAITANNVAWFNSTIQSCGYFLEPVNGVLPANKRVFLFTSTNITQSAHTFPNLTDTVIALFQCPGATSGHFANYDGNPGLRTTIITFSNPSPCSDTVTYNKINLVNINGGYGGGSALQNGATVLFSPNGTPTYINPGCNPQFVPFTLSINNPPTTACPGQLLQLSASATGQVYSIQWSGGNGTIFGAGLLNPTYQVSPADAGGFTLNVTATDLCGNTLTQSITVDVPVQQPLTITPSGPVNMCQGQSVTLTASGGAGTYAWSSGQNTAQISVNAAGTYVVSSSDACYSYSDTVEVIAIPFPDVSLSPSGNYSICQGNTLTISATFNTGTPQWSTGQSGSAIQVTQGGTYVATVSNGCGTDSDTLIVTVSTEPSVAVAPSDNILICNGLAQTVTASGAQNYVWSTGSTNSSVSFTQPGTYWVSGSNACGTDTVLITVTAGQSPVAQIAVQGDTVLCPGETITLTSVNGSTTDQWSTGVTGIQTTVSSAPVTVTLTVNNACGSSTDQITISSGSMPSASVVSSTGNNTLCSGSTLTLTASGGDSYLWNTGATTPSITVSSGGTYTVTVSNICGSDNETVTINSMNSPSPLITPAGSTSFCEGDSLMLTASGGDTYLWSTGENTPTIYVSTGGNYTLTATNPCGSAQTSINLTLISLPEVDIITQGPVALCQGAQVTIEATANEPITWSNGATGSQVTVATGGTLTASASNACGTATSTIVINEIPTPQVDIVQNSPLVVCSGSGVILEATSNLIPVWNSSQSGFSLSVTSPGTYVATVSNQCGTDSDSVQVIFSGPVASFTADPPMGNAPLNVLFSSTSSGATSLQWDVGGTAYSVPSFNHTFYSPGTFDVTLVVSDDLGCSDTATLKVIVDDQVEVFIPNVFTPNGDGINDEFKIVATGIKTFQCFIFNRWGNEIYFWDDVFKGWDGSSLWGGKASSGAYVYIARITTLGGEERLLHGVVTLCE